MIDKFKIDGPILINQLYFPVGVENANIHVQVFGYIKGVIKKICINHPTVDFLKRLKELAEAGAEFPSLEVEAKTVIIL